MTGSNSSIHGDRHGEEEPPVAWAELRQMADSLLQAMERMLDARIPANGQWAPQHQYDESGAENSGAGHDRFKDGHSGGRWAGHHGQDGGRAHGHGRGHRVHSNDEEFDNCHQEEESDENPFDYDRRRADHGDREHHHGHRNWEDSDNIARVKLSIPKFTGREDADTYLEWAEQYDQIFRVHNLSDQRRVNLALVEFSGYALTWWNQIQENQLVLGREYINTWEEIKQVMRRLFVPSSYQRDLDNRLQMLKQGKDRLMSIIRRWSCC